MPTIFILVMWKYFVANLLSFMFICCNAFQIKFVFFGGWGWGGRGGGLTAKITLWFWILKLNRVCLFPFFAACTSGEYLNGLSGFFSSPNFPSNYPQYSKCTWNITVPSGYIIKLSFLYFRLEPYRYIPCYNARVTVTNVASDDGYQPFMLCGQSLFHPVYSIGNSVQVKFTSLRSQYPGFNATYTAITYSSGTWYDWVKI